MPCILHGTLKQLLPMLQAPAPLPALLPAPSGAPPPCMQASRAPPPCLETFAYRHFLLTYTALPGKLIPDRPALAPPGHLLSAASGPLASLESRPSASSSGGSMGKPQQTEPQTRLVKPRTKAGKRALEKRAPKLVSAGRRHACVNRAAVLPPPPPLPPAHAACATQTRALPRQVEDPRRALLCYGNKTSQVVKDVMTDLQKLKGVRPAVPGAAAAAAACRHRSAPPPPSARPLPH